MFERGRVDGALAASVFHSGAIAIPDLKRYLRDAAHRGAAVTPDDVVALDWDKGGGLLPAIVQHAAHGRVLMLGYMNDAALRETLTGGRVVFYSRAATGAVDQGRDLRPLPGRGRRQH